MSNSHPPKQVGAYIFLSEHKPRCCSFGMCARVRNLQGGTCRIYHSEDCLLIYKVAMHVDVGEVVPFGLGKPAHSFVADFVAS